MTSSRAPTEVAPPADIDLQARVALAHAGIDALARAEGLDVVHVKGPALDSSLRGRDRNSTDADVLVRPEHVDPLVAALRARGWRLVTDFRNGSLFEHAANYHHDHWGYVDLHRSFPGVGLPSAEAFDLIWAERRTTQIAHREVCVPSLLDQAVLLCLHAARGWGGPRADEDLEHAFWRAEPDRQQAIRQRATQLRADVALAAALRELADYAGADQHLVGLWRYLSEGGSRTDEWRARLRAAPTLRARVAVAGRALVVNREFETMLLGHRPTRRELVGLQLRRASTAAAELGHRLRRADTPR